MKRFIKGIFITIFYLAAAIILLKIEIIIILLRFILLGKWRVSFPFMGYLFKSYKKHI